MQVGDEVLSEYMVSLAKQLKKSEKTVFSTGARDLDGPMHNVLPGDYVYVKSLSDSSLETRREGTYQVLLTAHTASKVEGLIVHCGLLKRRNLLSSNLRRQHECIISCK